MEKIVSTCQKLPSKFSLWIYFSLPALLLILAIHSVYSNGLIWFFGLLSVASFLLIFAIFMKNEDVRKRKLRVSVDRDAGSISFEHAYFISSFLPKKPPKETVLNYADFIDYKIINSNNRITMEMRTTEGKVMIGDDLSNFRTLAEFLCQIIDTNKNLKEPYNNALVREPIIKTPWYGWLLLTTAITIFILISYRFMYA